MSLASFAVNPTTFAIAPTTLVMRPDACFYCGAEPENDERTLGDRFGIRYCGAHKSSAKRDSNAYLHETKCVKTRDALQHAVLGPFLALLHAPHAIKRTNGAWDAGWTLQSELFTKHAALVQQDGVWHIPMIHKANDVAKLVRLPTFLDDAFLAQNPGSTRLVEMVGEVRRVLDEGVYAADYEAVLTLTSSPMEVAETSIVEHAYVNGVVVRMLDHASRR